MLVRVRSGAPIKGKIMADDIVVLPTTLKLARKVVLSSAKTFILEDNDLEDDIAIERLKIKGVWEYIENDIKCKASEWSQILQLESILNERTLAGEFSC